MSTMYHSRKLSIAIARVHGAAMYHMQLQLVVVQGRCLEYMYYVYVLLSEKDSNFYIGFSENVEQRLDEHNAGKNVSTKLRRPFKLIYCEGHTAKSDALRRESYFKTSKGKTTLKQILKDALLRNKSG